MSIQDRIRSRLSDLKITARSASIQAGLGPTFIKDILSGRSARPQAEAIIRLASVLKTTSEYLIDGLTAAGTRCPIVGYVGMNSMLYTPKPTDGHANGEDLEFIDVPPGSQDVEAAAIVRGNSQLPVLHDGDIVFWGRAITDIGSVVGRECMTRLSDGNRMLKAILPGSKPGLYTLTSHNDTPIIDVRLIDAAPILWVKRRGA